VLPYDSKAGRGVRVRFDVDRSNAGKVVDKRRVTHAGAVLNTVNRTEKE
jgi:hypothetical protein